MLRLDETKAFSSQASNKNEQAAGLISFNGADALNVLAEIQRERQLQFGDTLRHCEALSRAIKAIKRAWRGQSRIVANRASIQKSKLARVAKPDAANTANKMHSAINTRVRKLPKYAANSNPSRLVQILCKGNCAGKRGRYAPLTWAEMNADYPGREVLWRSQVGDFRATCLRCGSTALDCYNWLR